MYRPHISFSPPPGAVYRGVATAIPNSFLGTSSESWVLGEDQCSRPSGRMLLSGFQRHYLSPDMWPEPIPLREMLYGNLEQLRRTAAFVRATGICVWRTTTKKKNWKWYKTVPTSMVGTKEFGWKMGWQWPTINFLPGKTDGGLGGRATARRPDQHNLSQRSTSYSFRLRRKKKEQKKKTKKERKNETLFIDWLLYVQAACLCFSGTDLLWQL